MVQISLQKGGGNSLKDPVCGMDIEKGEEITHNGKHYKFCSAACRWAFEKNPEQFTENK